MSQQDKFNRVVASLHEATLDDTRWDEAAALIGDACGVLGDHADLPRFAPKSRV